MRGETDSASRRASLLGFVAHEVRNPLSTALWSAELLARLSIEERGGARGEKLAGMCLRSLQRLRILVEDHFLAERIEAGGMPVRVEAIPLREVVKTSAERVGAPSVTIGVDEDLTAWVDRGLLERTLDGVIAVAARGKTPVHVDGARGDDLAVLRVRGAPPAADALQPPQKGTASDPAGRALALHMAVHVAQALGGSLSVSGDQYVLSLPLAPAGANTDAP